MPVLIENARRFLSGRQERRNRILDDKYECAVSDFNKIKGMIVERYNPRRIYQWGSLLDRSHFREYSDIDIAVEGVNDPESFFKMYGDAEKLTSFPLDLLDIEKIPTEFAEIIKSKGKIVYER